MRTLRLLFATACLLAVLGTPAHAFLDVLKDALNNPQLLDGLPGTSAPSAPPGSSQSGAKNPFKGLEISFGGAELILASLKQNRIMLTRMEVSTEARWMQNIALPAEGTGTSAEMQGQNRHRVYVNLLESQLRQNFSAVDYYGDVDVQSLMGNVLSGDLFAIGAEVADTTIMQMMLGLGENLMHQRRIIDYMPEGFDKRDYHNYCTIDPVRFQSYCEDISRALASRCDYFDKPLEVTLFDYMAEPNRVAGYMDTPVDTACLARAESVQGRYFANVEEALKSLVPHHHAQRIETMQLQMQGMLTEQAEVQQRIARTQQLLAERGDAMAAEERTMHTARLDEGEARLEQLEDRVEQQELVLADAFATASQQVRITPENVELAGRLLPVLQAVEDNSERAVGGITLILAKAALDIPLLVSAVGTMGNAEGVQQVASAMAHEAVAAGRCASPSLCMGQMTDRLHRMVQKAPLFIANVAAIYATALRQMHWVAPRIEFLQGMVEAGRDLQIIEARRAELASRDADGDGVGDYRDRCADTPPDGFFPVDETGCPAARLVRLPIGFGTGSTAIAPQYRDEVAELAGLIRSHPVSRVVVEGHTDSSGSHAGNVQVSLLRAQRLADMLVNEFAVEPQIVVKGAGPDVPIADNATREGRLANRRLDVWLHP